MAASKLGMKEVPGKFQLGPYSVKKLSASFGDLRNQWAGFGLDIWNEELRSCEIALGLPR